MLSPRKTDYKVKLVYHDTENNIAVESVWAEKEGDYYRIKNAPFFAPNIAYNDLVSAEDDGGELFFDELIERSGHSTIQIIIYDQIFFDEITYALMDMGCDWEGSHLKGYVSVDVPVNLNYKLVRNFLDKAFQENKLDYKEASLAHTDD